MNLRKGGVRILSIGCKKEIKAVFGDLLKYLVMSNAFIRMIRAFTTK
jgi:hypothetical protein